MDDISLIEVNLSALDHNLALLKHMVGPNCSICPILKADAYGLGAVRIAKRFAAANVPLLAVYTPEQAAELFRNAVPTPVLVLMPVRAIDRVDELYRGLVAGRLHLTVHDRAHVDQLLVVTERYGVTLPLHLEIDTGMTRGGCSPEDAGEILQRIASARRLRLAGIFTHFARAESDTEFTDQQVAIFDDLLEEHAAYIPEDCHIHVASTFAALRAPRYHRTMIRVGLAWTGYGAEWITRAQNKPAARDTGEIIADAQFLQPAVTWRSRIVQVKRIPAGAPIGYGSRWTAKRDSVIGLVPVGYADGYPMNLSQTDANRRQGKRACVGVHLGPPPASGLAMSPAGQRAYVPVVGAVNMDQITVDLTDVAKALGIPTRSEQKAASAETPMGSGGTLHSGVPAQNLALAPQPGVGTIVELISPDSTAPNHLPTLAALAGTIPHDMLCRLNPRIKRIYTTPTVAIAPTRRTAAPSSVPTSPTSSSQSSMSRASTS